MDGVGAMVLETDGSVSVIGAAQLEGASTLPGLELNPQRDEFLAQYRKESS